ncbi:MAG: DEAD/DEAH box helicase [Myxococcales bacterium]
MEARVEGRVPGTCVPVVRLTTLHFTVNRGDAIQPDYEDVVLPVIALAFDYGTHRVEAGDLDFDNLADNDTSFMQALPRDRASEHRARVLLESYGAVDLDCLEDYGRDLEARADYLVHLEEDPAAYCAFTANAVPELVRMGFVVEIDPSYPYRLIQSEVSWYSELDADSEKPGWFNLELGVEIEGNRVSLVPVLLEMLERSGDIASLRALERGTERLLVVQAGDHGYVRVEPDRLRRLWSVLLSLYERGTDRSKVRLPIHEAEAGILNGLRAAVGAPEDELSSEGSVPEPGLCEPEPIDPASLPVRATLRPYQLHGVAWLQQLRKQGVGGILADDMGLGKTLQTITHLAIEHNGAALTPPSLIVCPTSLVGNWQRELSKFAPQLRVRAYHGPDRHTMRDSLDGADLIITSYPILLRDGDILEALEFHLLVLDEAQAIKNSSSSVHQAVKALKASHRLCISGTPVENHLGELWSQFDFLRPGWLGSEAAFRARYAQTSQNSLRDDTQLAALHQRVTPYVLRRMKDTVAPDLPPKINSVVPVELTGKQRELYESIRASAHHDVRRAIRVKGIEGSLIQVLDALTKLRQACCDPRLVSLEAARFVRESAKLARLMQLLEAHLEVGRRVLVFSQFTSMLSLIGKSLAEKHIDYLELTGATQNRQAKVDAFEKGHADVFLISLKAGGTGLNLTSADTVIHYDPWWNPAAQDQATDRAYRIGQKKPVLVQELLVVGSVEERMRALAESKRELARAILHGQLDDARSLTEKQVDDLFAPLRE